VSERAIVCPDAPRMAALLGERERDTLDAAGQGALNRHLEECGSCRAHAVASDPTLLFALLSVSCDPEGDSSLPAGRGERRDGSDRSDRSDRSDDERERLVAGVLAATAVSRSGSRLERFERKPRPVLLRAASIALLGVGIAGLWASRSPRPLPEAAGTGGETSLTSAASRPSEPPPSIEGVDRPGVQVYQFASTAPGEPTVVFVVDRNADL
jgi:hypothetical protein